MATASRTVRRRVASRARRTRPDAIPAPAAGQKPLPRITRLMALAILFDELLRSGRVASMAELARLCRVSRPRVSQIMDLLNLSPAIQERLLTSPPEGFSERAARPVAGERFWDLQWRRTGIPRQTTSLGQGIAAASEY